MKRCCINLVLLSLLLLYWRFLSSTSTKYKMTTTKTNKSNPFGLGLGHDTGSKFFMGIRIEKVFLKSYEQNNNRTKWLRRAMGSMVQLHQWCPTIFFLFCWVLVKWIYCHVCINKWINENVLLCMHKLTFSPEHPI